MRRYLILALVSFLTWTASAQKEVYLFCYFIGNGQDGLHMAYSTDGLSWQAMNDGKSYLAPKIGKDKLMRDPCIFQGPDGTFQMVWTSGWWDKGIGYASSKDLITWSEQKNIPVMEKEPEAKNCWAPEVYYDAYKKEYFIFWATTIPGRHSPIAYTEKEKDLNHRIYYVTTKDFNTFSETKMFFNPSFSAIDATIIQKEKTFYMILKNENPNPPEKNIRVTKAQDAEGPYPVEVSAPITGNYWAEGPSALQVGDYVYVYFDKYRNHKYGAVRSRDMVNWEDISDQVSFPSGVRHGTAFKVSQKIFDNLVNNSRKLPNETNSIQKSIDSCANAGGGTVTIKPGVHMISPIYLKSKVTLNVAEGATLLGTDNPDDYMVDGKYISLINGKSLTDVSITGKGIIDGNGASWWKRFLDSGRKIPRPRMIVLSNINNLRVEDVTLKNSPTFHFVPTDCENVIFKNVYVVAPDSAPNTDGIDPSRCKNVKIIDCKFDVGDDCIAIKSNKTEKGTGFLCENIEITGCSFYHGHGLSIGSETSGGVNNLKVENCKFYGTENGIRIKSSNERGGMIENVSYTNITMEGVGKPILFDFTYVDKNSIYRDGPKAEVIFRPSLKGVTIKNLTATNANKAGIMLGTAESILTDIQLENVDISAKTGFQIENAKDLKFENVKIKVKKGDVYLLKNAEGTGLN